MNVVPMPNTNPLLEAALQYAAIGWHVIPIWWINEGKCACGSPECKSPGKHPIGALAPWGQNSATTDVDIIKRWWIQHPTANIAAYLGPSKLVAIDIDPRNGGLQTIEDIEAKHGALESDVLQFTGGGGEHRVFDRPDNLQMPGKLGRGVDVKANGYIMLEPSAHLSGGSYVWEASSDPRDGIIPSPLPDWIRDLAVHQAPTSGFPASSRPIEVDDATKADLLQALQEINLDKLNRDDWVRVGMALHSTGDTNWAFEAFDVFSQRSPYYNRVGLIKAFRSFKSRGLDGVTYKTIFHMAKAELVPVASGSYSEPVPAKEVEVAQAYAPIPVDNQLLIPPGVLSDVVDWINVTSSKPQPQFAVQAALAFASVVMGRRFVSSNNNWSPLWFLNIGQSGCGKEHSKTSIEELLTACELGHLIGPSGYSSDSGLLSSLHSQPNHVTVIDEFHRVLEQASVKGNARAQSMLRALMEVWGRTGGAMRPTGYSTFGMTKAEAKEIQDRTVHNPAITIMAMSIPSFWETIGSQAARDGFLNRFLITQTDYGRSAGQFVPRKPVPQTVIDWAKNVRALYTSVIDPDSSPISVAPVTVPFSTKAMATFNAFNQECVDLMNEHEELGLAEMFSRCNENAMKLSLICALARDARQISEQDAEWSIHYVRTYSLRTVQNLKQYMADSPFEAAKKQVYHLILAAGDIGLTTNDINRRSRKFRGMSQRLQAELLNSMAALDEIRQVAFPSESGRGKPRNAWVAISQDAD